MVVTTVLMVLLVDWGSRRLFLNIVWFPSDLFLGRIGEHAALGYFFTFPFFHFFRLRQYGPSRFVEWTSIKIQLNTHFVKFPWGFRLNY